MTGFEGRAEFFSREAADYLRELGPLLGGDEPPPGNALVRLTRALRGAAMLAGPPAYARAARELERIAGLLPAGGLDWPGAAPVLREALAVFEQLAAAARNWDPSADAQAEALEARLGALTRRPGTVATGAPEAPAREEGLRGFAARETAAIAGAARAAAQAAEGDPAAALGAIGRTRQAMRSLVGLAGLEDFSPLGELLDAMDGALAELVQHPAAPAAAGAFLREASEVLGTLASEIATTGRPRSLDAVDRVTASLRDTFALGAGTFDIEGLLAGEPAAPAPPADPADPVELAALGERLRDGAAQLRAAASPAARNLRALSLLWALRAAPGGLGRAPAGGFLKALAMRLESPFPEGPGLVDLIDQAGERLVTGGALDPLLAALAAMAPEDAVPIERLAPEPEPDAVVPIEALAPEPEPDTVVPIEALSPEPEPDTIVPIEALAPEPEPDTVVPIEALAPEPEPGTVVPIEALAPEPEPLPELPPPPAAPPPGVGWPAERNRLELTLTAYSRLMATQAPVLPLEALVPPAVPPRAPRGSRAAAVEVEAELDVVPITVLLYRGPGAMARAEDVRRLLLQALHAASGEMERVEPLVRELLDLVPLAAVDGA